MVRGEIFKSLTTLFIRWKTSVSMLSYVCTRAAFLRQAAEALYCL